MTIYNFKEFLNNLIVENLHPELQSIVTSSNQNKQKALSDKIKTLTYKGEDTGIEGNMPKGSSRAYMKHKEPHAATVDGKPVHLETGTKVAIKSVLDSHHNKKEHDGLSLGQMQNRDENDDRFTNGHYRTLTHHEKGHYTTNHDGIFPPLIDHDDKDHHWAHVGHSHDIKAWEFRKLTKTKEHKNGISHEEFIGGLDRIKQKDEGNHWENPNEESRKKDDAIENHPLVQMFSNYHRNSGNPHDDLRQKKNMGVWHHPDGSKHIVARDHGYSSEVAKAYSRARKNKYKYYGVGY